MSRCFITQQVPNHLVTKYEISQAGVNFCNKIVNTGAFDKAFAFPVISIIPDISEECKKDTNFTYIQFRKFSHKGLGKLLNLIFENINFVKCGSKFDHIWFYNLNNGNIISYVLLKYFLRKKVYALMADFRPGKKWSLKGLLEWFINNSNGIISLSSRSIFTNKNFICIPGIIPETDISQENIIVNEKVFLLSGVLKEETGLNIAIEVFKQLPHVKLIITGMMSDEFSKEIENIPNIEYHGYVTFEKYKEITKKIAVGLSFRDPSHPMNYNNFPSKILEYFSLGKIVISTIEYPEISDMTYFKVKYSSNDIVNCINYIYNKNIDELKEFYTHSVILRYKFSEKAWIQAFNQIEKAQYE